MELPIWSCLYETAYEDFPLFGAITLCERILRGISYTLGLCDADLV